MQEHPPSADHAAPADDVIARLDSDPDRGLTDKDAQARLKDHGPNKLRRHESTSLLTLLAHQGKSVIVWLLAAAAAVSVVMGDRAEALAIAVVLAINGAIGFFTELRATRSMEALMHSTEPQSRVRRAGKDRMIAARDLVPGDIVVLAAGDVVTADLRLIKTTTLKADESVLTGESLPVAKDAAPVAEDVSLGDRSSMAFKGTAITQGSGEGIVVATGMQTQLGRISDLAQSAEAEVTPLEQRLDQLGHRLLWLTLGLAALTVAAGLMQGQPLSTMVQTGVALAVAAVPEGLPVVATLSLARGMWRMSARKALIRRLSSVETLGATTVILTDKTGTLTENRMRVARFLLAEDDIRIGGRDAGESGLPPGRDVDPSGTSPLDWAIRIGALCNGATLGDGPETQASGDPMELALLRLAKTAGAPRAQLIAAFELEEDHGFDPERHMMATRHDSAEGPLFAVKGAPEAVLAQCDKVMGPQGTKPLDDAARSAWERRIETAAGDGLRLLGLAMKHGAQGDDPYKALILVGFVALQDPIRPDVPEAIAQCRSAGVRVVMLTGDHADTARSIAQATGLADGDLAVITGRDLADLNLESLGEDDRARVLAADVFARITPETKLTLVQLYQDAGHVVAMTGDGVNDAPALKKADIGIAMGQRGTQVAQDAAHMVLRDDAFASIVAAMRQGRVIFANIRKFVVYLMSCNVSEVLVVGLAVGAGLPMPLLPLQILFLNLVTDVFPAFALGLGRGDRAVMYRAPRDPEEPILDRARWGWIGGLGVAITIATLGAFVTALYGLQLGPEKSVTVAFLTLALAQLWNVFNMRDRDTGILRNDVTGNRYVWGAIALCLGLIGLALWLPGLAAILSLAPPGQAGLALAGGASLMPLVFGQLWIVAKAAPDAPPAKTSRQGTAA